MILKTYSLITDKYSGPGDIVGTGASGWWGLRAYSWAIARAGTKKICQLRRGGDNVTADFLPARNGGVGLSTNSSDSGASNGLTPTGFSTHGSGDGTLWLSVVYDQIASADAVQTTAANQPQFIPNSLNGLPTIRFDASNSQVLHGSAMSVGATATWTVYATGICTGNFTSYQVLMQLDGGAVPTFAHSTSANIWTITGGAGINQVAADNVWHTAILSNHGVGGGPNGSNLLFDGSGINTSDNNSVGNGGVYWGAPGGAQFWTGNSTEIGAWIGYEFSSIEAAALQANVNDYWGLPDRTTSWVNAVVANGGTVSPIRQILVRNLINGLIADSVWNKLDNLWLYAAENQPSALVDIIRTQLATNVNSTTFATDRGYTGNGSNMLIDSGVNPYYGGINFVRDSCCTFAWDNTITPTGGGGCLLSMNGSGQNRLDSYISGGYYFCNLTSGGANVSGFNTLSPYNGLYLQSRTGSLAYYLDHNGIQFDSDTTNASAPINLIGNFTTLNSGGGFGFDQVSCVGFGGGLTPTDRVNLYNRLRTYMTAVGVS